MSSFTTTASSAFTLSHAKRIASKVATDLHRFLRFYGEPSESRIGHYEQELTELLKYDAIEDVTYGFKKAGEWITAIKYKSVNGTLVADDMPGSLRAGFEVTGASFYSYLNHGTAWYELSPSERERIESRLPFVRGSGDYPGVKDGYWVQDLGYSAGGRALQRSSIRRY